MSEEMRSDRVGEYLIPKVQEEFLFDELSDGYLGKTGLSDILSGVPVPIRKKRNFSGNDNFGYCKEYGICNRM